GHPNPAFVLDAPPLLRASWPLLLNASVERPDLLPSGSFGARIAERIWGDGAWLLWLDPDTPDPIDRAKLWQAKAREMLSAIEASAGRDVESPIVRIPDLSIPTIAPPWEQTGLSSISSIVLAVAARLFSR